MSYFYMKKSELFHCESRLTSLSLKHRLSCDNRAQTKIFAFPQKISIFFLVSSWKILLKNLVISTSKRHIQRHLLELISIINLVGFMDDVNDVVNSSQKYLNGLGEQWTTFFLMHQRVTIAWILNYRVSKIHALTKSLFIAVINNWNINVFTG